MAEIVNLRRFRKARIRSEAGKAADLNRVAFGRSKTERAASEGDVERAERLLDGHRLTAPASESLARDALDPSER